MSDLQRANDHQGKKRKEQKRKKQEMGEAKVSSLQRTGKNQDSPKAGTNRKRQRLELFLYLILLCVVIIILTLLILIKKPSEVEVNLNVSKVTFMMDSQDFTSLFSSTRATSLTLINFKQIELGTGDLEIKNAEEPSSAWQQIGTRSSASIIPNGSLARTVLENVRLNKLDFGPNAVIAVLSEEGDPDILKVRINDVDSTGHIAVNRDLLFSCNYLCKINGLPASNDLDSLYLRFTSKDNHEINFQGQKGTVTLGFELPPQYEVNEGNIRIVKDINLMQLDGDRTISTVSGGGKITFTEYKDRKVEVDAGDFVVIENLKVFYIKRIQKIDKGINITFHGRVGKLKTGPLSARFVRNRLPSYWEWLNARLNYKLHGVLIGVIALFAGKVFGYRKILKILKDFFSP